MKDLPIHAGQDSTPVFDCHVILKAPAADGRLSGFVSNLPEISETASNERELLRKLSTEFKARIIKYQQEGTPIPWQPIQKPQTGEQQRWLPVHL